MLLLQPSRRRSVSFVSIPSLCRCSVLQALALRCLFRQFVATAVSSNMEPPPTSATSDVQAGSSSSSPVLHFTSTVELTHALSCTASLGANGAWHWTGCSGRVQWAIHRPSAAGYTRGRPSPQCPFSPCSAKLLHPASLKPCRLLLHRCRFKHSCVATTQF